MGVGVRLGDGIRASVVVSRTLREPTPAVARELDIKIMGSITHSIVVNAPLRVVYNQWTQFEEFPLFMEGVEEVRQEGDKRLLWKAKIAGKDKQWEAEITEQVP